MRKTLFTLTLFFAFLSLKSQPNLDSLFSVWRDSNEDVSVRANAYVYYIGYGFLNSKPDSAYSLTQELYNFGVENNLPRAQYEAFNLQGISWNNRGEADKALEAYNKALSIAQDEGEKDMVASVTSNIGGVYLNQTNYPKALDHYLSALNIYEELGSKGRIGGNLAAIGIIYKHQGDYTKALEYMNRALEIAKERKDKKQIASQLVNIGTVYKQIGRDSAALENNRKAMTLFDEVGDLYNKTNTLNNQGSIYHGLGDYNKAIKFYKLALTSAQKLGDKRKAARALYNLGTVHVNKEEYPRAIDYCKKGLSISEETGSLLGQETSCNCLYESYKGLGQMANALKYYEQKNLFTDSIYNEKNTEKLTRLEMQYKFDRKEAEAKSEQEKKDAIAAQKLKQERLMRNGFMGGFTVVLLFAGVFFLQRNRIGKEKERSEELLLNILPEAVAEELKEKGHSDAQFIDNVTVLFTDFKSFTSMSEMVTPRELVADLHACFSEFDRFCEKYNIEKIKTIGDAYMAARGLPIPNKTHAEDVTKAALEMAKVVEVGKAKKQVKGEPFFEIRIGIHTGPVVAGIVGVKKFQYDIWGDTVNTANRMESSGSVGRVNVSQSTYELLKKKEEFAFENRGKIKAKGKGEIEMHFVSYA
jgi:adenylate cyclase